MKAPDNLWDALRDQAEGDRIPPAMAYMACYEALCAIVDAIKDPTEVGPGEKYVVQTHLVCSAFPEFEEARDKYRRARDGEMAA